MTESPAPTLYDALGGEAGVRALVDTFYDRMEEDPAVAPLRAMHPPDLKESRDKLFWFLSGWLGGPPLFIQKRGHPRLRARHLPFAVDNAARDQWMACMRHALLQSTLDAPLRDRLEQGLLQLADHMRNT